jgi:hypothetical protein
METAGSNMLPAADTMDDIKVKFFDRACWI